jgi:hypothetical protein
MKISEVIPIFVTTRIFNVTKQMLRFEHFSLILFSRKSVRCSFLILLLSFSRVYGQTHAFSGNIGTYPIYLDLTINGDKVTGSYFYKDKLIDISLSGNYKSGMITLITDDENVFPDPERFQFKWPNKIPEGTWTKKGKSLPLKLASLTAKELNSPKCSNPYLANSNVLKQDLTRVKIGLFKLKETDSTRMINGIKVRYFREIHTGINSFRIDSGMVSTQQMNANKFLEFLQISEFLESLDCASYIGATAEIDYTLDDLSVSADFLCFSVFTAYYCGGPHPNEDNYGVNYNLHTQTKITPSDFVLPGKESAFDERVYAYLAKTNPELFDEAERAASGSVYTDCNYHEKDLWRIDYCPFVLTPNGIELLPSFAHFNAYCLDPGWAVIPYSELKDLIKPDFFNKLNKLKP